MKRTILIFVMIFLASCTCLAEITGYTTDPSDIGVGARPLALGKSFVGMSGDACGMFINPAGLADIKTPIMNSMTGQVLQDVNYTVFSGAAPSSYGTFGIGYIAAELPGIPVTTVTGSGTTAAVVPVSSAVYRASVFTLSYSNDLSKFDYFRELTSVKIGANLKYFTQGFYGGSSLMEGATGSGMDMDLGLQFKPRKEMTFGIVGLNLLPENMGGRFVWDKGEVEEAIPTLVKVGGTAKMWGKDSFNGGNSDVFLGLDMDMYPSQGRPSVYHGGLEWWPISVMALRVGVDQKPKGAEDGISVDNNLTAGVGLKFNGFTFDYAFHQFSDLTENNTHFFSIGYAGNVTTPKSPARSKKIIPVIVAKASLESFADVPKGYWAKSPIEFMATLGVMNGYYDGKFRPDDTVTRSELALMLVKLKGLDINEATSDPYPDVSKEHWAAKYIKVVSYIDLMGSYPDGTFRPDKNVSRLEGVVTLSRFTEAPEPASLTKDPFVDISRSHWAAKYLAAAQNYGLLDYLIGKKFEPNADLSRAEMAELLSKTSYGKDKIRKYLETGTI